MCVYANLSARVIAEHSATNFAKGVIAEFVCKGIACSKTDQLHASHHKLEQKLPNRFTSACCSTSWDTSACCSMSWDTSACCSMSWDTQHQLESHPIDEFGCTPKGELSAVIVFISYMSRTIPSTNNHPRLCLFHT